MDVFFQIIVQLHQMNWMKKRSVDLNLSQE